MAVVTCGSVIFAILGKVFLWGVFIMSTLLRKVFSGWTLTPRTDLAKKAVSKGKDVAFMGSAQKGLPSVQDYDIVDKVALLDKVSKLENEIAQKLKTYDEDATDVEDLKNKNEMKAESTHWNGKATAVLSGSGSCTDQDCKREEESSVSISNATFMNRDENDLGHEEHTLFDAVLPEHTVSSSGSSLFVENNSSFPMGEVQARNKEDKVKLEVCSAHLEGSLHKRKEERVDSIVKSEVYSRHLEGSAHTRNEKWLDSTTAQQLEGSTRDTTGVEDLKNTNGIKAESIDWKGKATSGSCSCIDYEYEQEKGNSDSVDSTSQATSINRDENCLLEDDHMPSDLACPECTSSSKSSLSIENKSSFPEMENQTQNGEDKPAEKVADGGEEDPVTEKSPTEKKPKAWKNLKEDVASSEKKKNHLPKDTASNEKKKKKKIYILQDLHLQAKRLLCPSTTLMPGAVVSHADNNVVETVTKHASGTKFQNADKPKRRLLPVSSILLKDIGSINFKDENEKPKGVKAEKKGASGENRTQGSISLLRLLKYNLAI